MSVDYIADLFYNSGNKFMAIIIDYVFYHIVHNCFDMKI